VLLPLAAWLICYFGKFDSTIGTVVEHSSHITKIKGSNPSPCTWREKMARHRIFTDEIDPLSLFKEVIVADVNMTAMPWKAN
jgi:hypothetical protein